MQMHVGRFLFYAVICKLHTKFLRLLSASISMLILCKCSVLHGARMLDIDLHRIGMQKRPYFLILFTCKTHADIYLHAKSHVPIQICSAWILHAFLRFSILGACRDRLRGGFPSFAYRFNAGWVSRFWIAFACKSRFFGSTCDSHTKMFILFY